MVVLFAGSDSKRLIIRSGVGRFRDYLKDIGLGKLNDIISQQGRISSADRPDFDNASPLRAHTRE